MRTVVSILVVFSIIFSHSAELLAGKEKRRHDASQGGQVTPFKIKKVDPDRVVDRSGLPQRKFDKDESVAFIQQIYEMLDCATQVAVHSNGEVTDQNLLDAMEIERASSRKFAMGNYQDLRDVKGKPFPYTPTPYNPEYYQRFGPDTIFVDVHGFKTLSQLPPEEKVKSYVFFLKRSLPHMVQSFLLREKDDKFLAGNVHQFVQSRTSIFLSQAFYSQLPERVRIKGAEIVLDKDGIRKYLNIVYLMKLNANLMDEFYALLFGSGAFKFPTHLKIIQRPSFLLSTSVVREKQPFEEFQSQFIAQYQSVFYRNRLNEFLNNEVGLGDNIKSYLPYLSLLFASDNHLHLMMEITYRDYLRNLLALERLKAFLNFIQTEAVPLPKLRSYPSELKQFPVVVFNDTMDTENLRKAFEKGFKQIQPLTTTRELSDFEAMSRSAYDLLKNFHSFICTISQARQSDQDDSYSAMLPMEVFVSESADPTNYERNAAAFREEVVKTGIPNALKNIGYFASQWLLLNIFTNNFDKLIDAESLNEMDHFLDYFCRNPFYGQEAHNFLKLKGYFRLHEMTEVAFRLYREGSDLFLKLYSQMRELLYRNLTEFKESGLSVEELNETTFYVFLNKHRVDRDHIEFLVTLFENLSGSTQDQKDIDFYSASIQDQPNFYDVNWRKVIENTPGHIEKLLRFCATRLIFLRSIYAKMEKVLGVITPQVKSQSTVASVSSSSSAMEVERDLSFIEGELEGARMLLEDEKGRNNLLQAEIATLKEEVAVLKMQLLQLVDTKVLEAEVQNLKEIISEKEKEIQKLHDQAKQDKEKMTKYSAEVKALKADKAALEQAHAERIRTLNQQIVASNTEKNKSKKEVESLQAQAANATAAARAELTRMTDEIARKEAAIQRLREDKKRIIDSIQLKHKAEIDALHARIQELKSQHLREVEGVQSQLASARARIADLEVQINGKDHEIEVLGERLDEDKNSDHFTERLEATKVALEELNAGSDGLGKLVNSVRDLVADFLDPHRYLRDHRIWDNERMTFTLTDTTYLRAQNQKGLLIAVIQALLDKIKMLGQTNTGRANLIEQLMRSQAQVDANNISFATSMMEGYNRSGGVPFGKVRLPKNAQEIMRVQHAEIHRLISEMGSQGHNEALSALLLGNNEALLENLSSLKLTQTRKAQALVDQYDDLKSYLDSHDPELLPERRVELEAELRDLGRQIGELQYNPSKKPRKG